MRLMSYAKNFSSNMRARRFELFKSLVEPLPRPVSILDFGGTTEFWERCGWAGDPNYQITIVNLFEQEQVHDNIRPHVGDATSLPEFEDNSFDLVFSNSVIEHLFTHENQKAMGAEVQRLAPRCWVQTPNYWFPMEPHFHFIGWQWLPEAVRVGILRRRACGWHSKTKDPELARELVREVRLMTRGELREIFPDSLVLPEKCAGLTKSWMVVRGFGEKIPVLEPATS